MPLLATLDCEDTLYCQSRIGKFYQWPTWFNTYHSRGNVNSCPQPRGNACTDWLKIIQRCKWLIHTVRDDVTLRLSHFRDTEWPFGSIRMLFELWFTLWSLFDTEWQYPLVFRKLKNRMIGHGIEYGHETTRNVKPPQTSGPDLALLPFFP